MAKKTTHKPHKKRHVLLFWIIIFILFVVGAYFGKSITMSVPSDLQVMPLDNKTIEAGGKDVYKGVFPCADCPGIETVLTMHREKQYQNSGTYELQEIYQERNVKPYITKGTWTILRGTPTDSEALVYALQSSDASEAQYYLKVDDSHLKLLDSEKNEIDSPFDYTLTKESKAELANPATVSCEEKGGTSVIRKDAGGNEYGICKLPDGQECDEWTLFRDNECVKNY